MNIGFYYHIEAVFDADGSVKLPAHLGKFIVELAKQAGQVTFFVHETNGNGTQDFVLPPELVHCVNLGPKGNAALRSIKPGKFLDIYRANSEHLDTLLVRGPTPMLPSLVKSAGNLPVALLIVGNYLDGVEDLAQPRWRKELIRIWARWYQRQELKAAKTCATIVNGPLLFDQLRPHVPELFQTRTTTLSESDFYDRDDTCQSSQTRLLFAGRMDRGKGLLDIEKALSILITEGHDLVLDLVGGLVAKDPILDQVMQAAESDGIADRIIYHGFKPAGPELFSHYREADIFVTASTLQESFPRTIWEAMANSLPVVATTVGSVSHLLEDRVSAKLTEPKTPVALAQAIAELIQDSALRRKLISNGSKLARVNTLEIQTSKFVNTLKEWAEKKHRINDTGA